MIGEAMSISFVGKQQGNKVVVNLTDQYSVNNNCGFNLANFKPKFIREFFGDVVSDYNRSFIGSFCTALFERELPQNQHFDLYFSISRFSDSMGYSLTQNQPTEDNSIMYSDHPNIELHESKQHDDFQQTSKQLSTKNELLQIGTIQEFIHVTEIS